MRTAFFAGALVALTGCAGVPVGQGRAEVAAELAPRHGGEVDLAEAGTTGLAPEVQVRLAEPLTPQAAVEIAWRNSPRARAALAELQIAAGERFDHRRPHNPSLSAQRMGAGESSLGLSLPLTDLLLLPSKRRQGEAQWRQAIADAAATLLDEAAEVQAAYYGALAAQQTAAMREAVAEAAELSAELAGRFHAAGNLSALQLAREQAAASQARAEAAQARAARLAARMALAERLGLAGRSNRWRLPERLPLPPSAAEPDVNTLLERARAQRLDLQAAQRAREAAAEALGSTRRWRALGEVTLGVEREREDGERKTGPEIELELPLFHQGQGRLARAEGRYLRALQAVESIELGIEREVRSELARLEVQREIAAGYRDALIPQREAIVAREQERYNFMLIGVFELLAAKRQQVEAYQGYLEAIRDYWLARVALARAIGGRLPDDGHALEAAPALDDLLHPEDAGGHDHHGPGATP